MRSINDIRLVLGTILEVTDDGGAPEVDPRTARATYAVYEFLGFLLERDRRTPCRTDRGGSAARRAGRELLWWRSEAAAMLTRLPEWERAPIVQRPRTPALSRR